MNEELSSIRCRDLGSIAAPSCTAVGYGEKYINEMDIVELAEAIGVKISAEARAECMAQRQARAAESKAREEAKRSKAQQGALALRRRYGRALARYPRAARSADLQRYRLRHEIITTSKVCGRCGRRLPIDKFRLSRNNETRLNTCSDCTAKAKREARLRYLNLK